MTDRWVFELDAGDVAAEAPKKATKAGSGARCRCSHRWSSIGREDAGMWQPLGRHSGAPVMDQGDG